MSGTTSRTHEWARRAAVVITGVLVFMLIAWVLKDPRGNLETDWTSFDNAADRLFAGEQIYRPIDIDAEPLPYLYPPFVLWLAVPLKPLGFFGSFLFSALLTFVSFVVGLVLFSRTERASIDQSTGLTVGICSGAVVGSTLIGQYSGLYVFAFGAGAYLFSRDRQLLAGVVLGLLWMKPNIAIAVPVVLVWSRSWRTLLGCVGTGAVLLVSSLPFGVAQWSNFVANAQAMAELQQTDGVPYQKMVNVLGSVQTVFGTESTSTVALGVWLVTAAALGIYVLTLWTPARLEQSTVRAFGALALFIVAANPRLYFYDATLVVLGMFGIWMSAQTVGGALARKWTPALCVLVWLALWGNVFSGLNRLTGPAIALALVITAMDARHDSNAALLADIVPGENQRGSGPPDQFAAAA